MESQYCGQSGVESCRVREQSGWMLCNPWCWGEQRFNEVDGGGSEGAGRADNPEEVRHIWWGMVTHWLEGEQGEIVVDPLCISSTGGQSNHVLGWWANIFSSKKTETTDLTLYWFSNLSMNDCGVFQLKVDRAEPGSEATPTHQNTEHTEMREETQWAWFINLAQDFVQIWA